MSSKEIKLSFLFHSIRLDELVMLVYSFVKIGWKMAKLWPCEARAPKLRWPFWAILVIFWDMTFKCFARHLDQYWWVYNWIASNLAILCHKNLQKSTKSPISQFAILRKWTLHFFLLFHQFSIILHEIFRIAKKLNFALILGPHKILAPKIFMIFGVLGFNRRLRKKNTVNWKYIS